MSSNHDDLLASLLSMGFDIFLCRRALAESHAQTLEEATNWILSKINPQDSDEASTSSAPSLRLGNPNRASDSPFLPGFGGDEHLPTSPSSTSGSAAPVIPMEEEQPNVVDNNNLVDNERSKLSRKSCEEVVIAKAVDEAKRIKRQQSESKAAILRQIQEDRQTLKDRRTVNRDAVNAVAPSTPALAPNVPKSESTSTTIQLRLPSGKSITGTFQSSATIDSVLSFARQEAKGPDADAISGHITFLQPFPRRVFDPATESDLSLSDAGLVPRAALHVLKPEPPPPASQPADEAPPDAMEVQATPRQWNLPGRRLGGGGESTEDEDDDPDYQPDNDAEEDEPEDMHTDDDEQDQHLPTGSDGESSDDGMEGPEFFNVGGQVYFVGGGQRLSDTPATATTQGQHPLQNAHSIPTSATRQRRTIVIRCSDPPSLKTLTLKRVVAAIANPATSRQSLRLVSYLSPDLGSQILVELCRLDKLSSLTLKRLHSCPVESVDLSSYRLATNSLVQEIADQFYVSLRRLVLNSCSFLTDVAFDRMDYCRHLEVLELIRCRLTDKVLPSLSGLQNLTTLSFGTDERTQMTTRFLHSLSEAPLALTLQNLSVMDGTNKIVTPDLFTILPKFPKLAILTLQKIWLSQPLTPIQPAMSSSLVMLNCVDCGFTDQDVENVIVKLTNLEELRLNQCTQITATGLELIATKMSKLSIFHFPTRHLQNETLYKICCLPLRELDLSESRSLTSAGFNDMHSLSRTLRSLYLNKVAIDDSVGEQIVKLRNLLQLQMDDTPITDNFLANIRAFRQLQSLSLSGCRHVTDEGVGHIVNSDYARTLSKLSLGRTGITDEGAESCEALVNLAFLNLEQTEVSSRALELRSKLPHLRTLRMSRIVQPESEE
ncbi:hypothetical protein DFS34DRAFT_628342 [Phlyctochytrium arcticum]|nr:hypothetical protein DFS34DRAFT_628342 [Phlyctochytrium arcticum]